MLWDLPRAGPPVPPVSVEPDGVAEKDALAKRLLYVTKVDRE